MNLDALKAGLRTALQAIEAPVEDAVEAAISATNPVAGAVLTEVVSTLRPRNTGIATQASTIAPPPVLPTPIPQADISSSALLTKPTDLDSVIAFALALADKVDALQLAVGHGSSAAMADHA